MPINAFVTKELLFAYFAGRASALQKQRIEHWRKDPANEEFFYACVHEWEMKNLQYPADVNQAIARFQQRITSTPGQAADRHLEAQTHHQAHAAIPAPAPGKWKAWLAAASVVVLGLGGWHFREDALYKNYQTGYGQISTITLPDGSRVTLNANSQLQVPRFRFGPFSRQVTLSGEASFAVTHTADEQKFVVLTHTPRFKVEVLGTEFNVFSRARATRVGLYRGKVKVLYDGLSGQQARAMTMAPGDLVTLENGQQHLQVSKVVHPENFAAWQQGRFVFEHTPLSEINAMLQENYGLRVMLSSPHLARQTISGSFKASSVNELLQALAETLEMDVRRQDSLLVFTARH